MQVAMQAQGLDGQPPDDVDSNKVFNLITFFFDLTYMYAGRHASPGS